MPRLLVLLLLTLLCLPVPPAVAQPACRLPEKLENSACAQQGPRRGEPGQFDYYVLALSWSPGFCATPRQAKANPLQCQENRFGFVVHGLWPQYAAHKNAKPGDKNPPGDNQPWPQYCQPQHQPLPEALLRRHLCRQPGTALMNCQWAKHGSCSGLAAPDYFAAIDTLLQRLTLPALTRGESNVSLVLEVFLRANAASGLKREHVMLIVKDAALSEIRICYAKNLTEFAVCDGRGGSGRPGRKLIVH